MGTIYFFDKHVKKHLMKGTKAVNSSNSGVFPNGVSCIREDDVNMWFYTKEGIAVAFDSGHRDFPGLEKEFRKIGINPKDIKNVFITVWSKTFKFSSSFLMSLSFSVLGFII